MTGQGIRRLAMWSGPRNISTALLRAWGSRADTHVVDEPLYGPYLVATGKAHPGREDILAACETDWDAAARAVTDGPLPVGRRLHYQKHMAHHLLPRRDHAFLGRLSHAFLIRDPARMLASLVRVMPDAALEDTGLPQQVAIFRGERERTGAVPPVLDAADVLADPERLLRLLCAAWDVPFDPAMLAWEPGPRETDGVWARHWYAVVEASTGFSPPPPPSSAPLPQALRPLHAECLPFYEELHAQRLGRSNAVS